MLAANNEVSVDLLSEVMITVGFSASIFTGGSFTGGAFLLIVGVNDDFNPSANLGSLIIGLASADSETLDCGVLLIGSLVTTGLLFG